MTDSAGGRVWRAEIDFVLLKPEFEPEDRRILTALHAWKRAVADPARLNRFASLEPDGPEGLVFDGVLTDMSPGQVAEATTAAALNALAATGLLVVGGGPVEVRLTSLPERPGISPGEPGQP